jgi:hypothetical protein
MKQLLQIVGVSCVLVLGACKKDEAASGSSGATSAKVDEKNNAPGFTPGKLEDHGDDPADPEMRIRFKKAQEGEFPPSFELSWYPKREPEQMLAIAPNMETDYKSGKPEEKGDFAGGKGKFFLYSSSSDPKSHSLKAVMHGKKLAYMCNASSYDAPIAPEVLAACKSITPIE